MSVDYAPNTMHHHKAEAACRDCGCISALRFVGDGFVCADGCPTEVDLAIGELYCGLEYCDGCGASFPDGYLVDDICEDCDLGGQE